MNELIHPDDRSWFLAIGTNLINFFSQLPPEYQGILLEHDENGGFLRSLSVHTDITYLKQEGHPY
jgi:hypothetical protein